MSEIQIDEALELLSNSYRREILKLITMKDRYAFELSKLLNISQRAVSNHLQSLKDIGILESEKRKSTKGPEREYFKLNRAVVLSLTLAPNLFLATIRSLDDNIRTQPPITPSLQLGMPKHDKLNDILNEGLNLLPQIREGLDLLEAQQSKLLRGYQGIRNHISDFLNKEGFSSLEIRLLLLLIEKEGELRQKEVELSIGPVSELTDVIKSLEEKNLITSELNKNEKGDIVLVIKLVTE